MCCGPIWTALGQTYSAVMEVEVIDPNVLVFFSFVTETPATRMNTDSYTGRAVHSGKRWMHTRGVGKCLASFKLAQDAGSSMWYMRMKVLDLVIAPLFLSLAGLLD